MVNIPHVSVGPIAYATLVRDIDATRHVTYATFCLLIYDHCKSCPFVVALISLYPTALLRRPQSDDSRIVLTISDEVHLVWKSRSVNLVKVLFVCNRYIVPVVLAVEVTRMFPCC